MFKTRASFQLGPNSILYLFLALAFNGKVSGTTYEEFGCKFASNEYNMIRNNKEQPAWSDVVMETNAVNNFEDMREPLKKLFSEASIMNELSLFSEFVGEYKNKSGNETLESFFNNYSVPIEPKKYCDPKNTTRKTRDPASYLIQELHALKENLKIKEIFVSPYLVSAYVDRINSNFSDGLQSPRIAKDVTKNIGKLLKKRVQDHLAGFIKINTGNRIGYILIDPGYANGEKYYQPLAVCVMEDGRPPHGEILSGPKRFTNDIIEIAVGDGNGNPFILVQPTLAKVGHVLYYVGKPYCSFMENTVKANLMKQYHGIIIRDSKGYPLSHPRFKMTPESVKNFQNHYFDTTDRLRTIDDRIKDVFGVPGTEVSNIRRQLECLNNNVFSDRKFLNKLIGLTKRLGLDSEPDEEPAKSPFNEFLSKNFAQKIIPCLNPKPDEN